MEKRYFECLRCGHYTPFDAGTRPRCGYCGCMTGLVDNNAQSPMFRHSRRTIATVGPKVVRTDD